MRYVLVLSVCMLGFVQQNHAHYQDKSSQSKKVLYYAAEVGSGVLHGYFNLHLCKDQPAPSAPTQAPHMVITNNNAATSHSFLSALVTSVPAQIEKHPEFGTLLGSGLIRGIALPADMQGDAWGIFLHGLAQFCTENSKSLLQNGTLNSLPNLHFLIGGALLMRKALQS